jgi:hypothetical protein
MSQFREASRAYERDYIDTAAALQRYAPDELIGFARRLDPGLTGRDFADPGQRLDRMPDEAFMSFGVSRQDVATLRERFATWPRAAEASEHQQDTHEQRTAGERNPGEEPAPPAGPRRRQEERGADADGGGAEIEP